MRTGPDLPAPHELFGVADWRTRWPSGSHKCELYAGILVYWGEFDQRDVDTGRRTYPGRRVILSASGAIEVHPGGDDEPTSVFEDFSQRCEALRETELQAQEGKQRITP
jgi:hypothetical protein